ncbi:MAG: DUF1566 domain-containing protein [Magnetococcales bacterium]|nr:DUF1566 domain-containing protein [Magnetococcales bacterium]
MSSTTTTVPSAVTTSSSSSSQSQTLSEKPHFTDNNDGTFTDNKTGLTWLKNAGCFEKHPWYGSDSAIETLKSGSCGIEDSLRAKAWRFPTVAELKTLVSGNSCPSVSADNPSVNVQCGCYWSSSEDFSDYKPRVWTVCFHNGLATSMLTQSLVSSFYVWPVYK